nr:immunoglobulin light chain junction region [Macaca mulatta]
GYYCYSGNDKNGLF